MGSGGRTACDVCGLHLRLSSLQLFSFFYAAAQLMSLPIYESPLPKGAPYLDDPAQIVMPQNEFVIRNDAGLVKKDCGLKKRFKRGASLKFLMFSLDSLTKKKTQLEKFWTKGEKELEAFEKISFATKEMRDQQKRLRNTITKMAAP